MTNSKPLRPDIWTRDVHSALYPSSLRSLEHPPERIFGRGDPELLESPCISIIGARKATPYGLACAKLCGRVAAESGLTVVSGGAAGCDAAALSAALTAGGKCIIVSGCGVDVIYPASSKTIFEKTIQQGALISLEACGQGPRRFAFPKRNKIIAALAPVLVVTEAGLKSGTMSTVDQAMDLGHSVYAIPGSIFSSMSVGVNALIANGAAIISSELDLETRIAYDYGQLRIVSEGMTREESRLLSALIAQPMRPDELSQALQENILETLKCLGDYEARGMVLRLRDGRYSPSESYLLSRGTMGTT